MSEQRHLGTGFGFPFSIGEDGSTTSVHGLEAARSGLRNVLTTPLLSLPGDRLFGQSVEEAIFRNPDTARALATVRVAEAVARSFRRGRLTGVSLDRKDTEAVVGVSWLDTQTGAHLNDSVSFAQASTP